MPKTANLYALKQERKKRGLDPDGKEDHLLPGSKASTKVRPFSPLARAPGRAPS